MMWSKKRSPVQDVFESTVECLDKVEKQKMYGYPCYSVEGTIFTGLYNQSWILRLNAEDRKEAAKVFDIEIFEPLPGRAMEEYIVLPKSVVDNEAQRKLWVEKSYAYACLL